MSLFFIGNFSLFMKNHLQSDRASTSMFKGLSSSPCLFWHRKLYTYLIASSLMVKSNSTACTQRSYFLKFSGVGADTFVTHLEITVVSIMCTALCTRMSVMLALSYSFPSNNLAWFLLKVCSANYLVLPTNKYLASLHRNSENYQRAIPI